MLSCIDPHSALVIQGNPRMALVPAFPQDLAQMLIQRFKILVGRRGVVDAMIENDRKTKRYTGLKWFLQNQELEVR